MIKKVLVCSVTLGSGHNSVANSIKNSLLEKNIEVEVYDYYSTNEKIKCKSNASFFNSNKFFPRITKIFFNLFRKKPYKIANYFFYKNYIYPLLNDFEKKIKEFKPDLVFCTQFTPAVALNELISTNRIKDIKTAAIVTDYVVAPFAYNLKDLDLIINPTTYTNNVLKELGFKEAQLLKFGIPVREQFLKSIRSSKTLSRFTILLMNGGSGFGDNYKTLKVLDKHFKNLNIIVINGKNEKIFNKIEKYKFRNNITNLQFVNDVEKYMAQADVVIGKMGGITISECFALRVPIISVKNSITPESINLKILEDLGVANGYHSNRELVKIIKLYIENPNKIKTLQENIDKLGLQYNSRDLVKAIFQKKNSWV